MIKTSNFIGAILDEAERVGIKKILWVGHIGKMIKVAGGIFHTHSRMADARMEVLAAHLGMRGAPKELIKEIMGANTTDDAISMIKDTEYMDVFNQLAQKVSERSMQRVFGNVEIGTILFSNAHGLLGLDETGKQFMENLKNE
jgi:cobalt-precorrin-5B (C1)-methyltransferase